MRNCFIIGCDKKNINNRKRPMFAVPKNNKDLYEKWCEIIPSVRPLQNTDRICCLHFNESDIEYYFEHDVNGTHIRFDRERPRLKPNAVPTLNFSKPEDIVNIINKKRRKSKALQLISKKSATIVKTPLIKDINTETVIKQPEILDTSIGSISCEILPDFENLYDEIFEVTLPNTLWAIHRCPNRTKIIISYMNLETLSITKMITINQIGNLDTFLNSSLLWSQNIFDNRNDVIEIISNILLKLNDTYK